MNKSLSAFEQVKLQEELNRLRAVYEAASRVLRYNGVDKARTIIAVDDLDAAIERVKSLDGGLENDAIRKEDKNRIAMLEESTEIQYRNEVKLLAEMEQDKASLVLYANEVERIWALMPELRNTEAHYELHEAVHEKLRQNMLHTQELAACKDKLVMLEDTLKVIRDVAYNQYPCAAIVALSNKALVATAETVAKHRAEIEVKAVKEAPMEYIFKRVDEFWGSNARDGGREER